MKVHDVEQRSSLWYAMRAGMPTASEFSKIVTSTGDTSESMTTYAMTLAAEKFAGSSVDAWEGNAWTDRGRDLESQAIALYELAHDLDVERVGFVTDDDQNMGCSPDGLVGKGGLIEVKCLKAENHIKTILYHQKHGKSPPDYIQQTQGQLLICEREWCDLVFYHPVLPLLTIRTEPDQKVQHAMMGAIPKLCTERDRILEVLLQYSR